MGALLGVLPLISQAFSVISLFKGTASAAKADSQIQDAIGVVTALTPLVKQFTSGVEVTEADVRSALAGKDAALKALDDWLAAQP